MAPPIAYARNRDVNIAYQVFGEGPIDLLMIPGWVSHLQIEWEEPTVARFLERIGSFARVIRFDKRGTGLSDRPPGVATPEERMEDAHAVLDAAHVERAAVWGWSEGGPLAILFAATYPGRTTHLVLYGTRAALGRRDGPDAVSEADFEARMRRLEETWAREPEIFRSPKADAGYRAWLMRFQPAAASPAAAVGLMRANRELDVRALLHAVHVPTLVVSRRDDPVSGEADARRLAEGIAGAKLAIHDGADHAMWLGDAEALAGEVEEFLIGERHATLTDRVLATILIMDVEGSTAQLARLGDARWRDLVAEMHAFARRQLAQHNGREVDMVGDQVMAAFDGPVRAIRCARAIQRDVSGIGIALRAGLHTGEVERAGEALRGVAVHVTARIAALAAGGEILVSDTTRDIVAGSGLAFADRGTHALKGIDEPRRIFAVV
ncbi:MAG TPA: adenylate/guanylate cyclase domain-containing protein [Candidatus Limnocylindria bacterium]|nr:adenylate/guanylate cyclase domain-containing protein [Candidatus Limnocylindria bacterium]